MHYIIFFYYTTSFPWKRESSLLYGKVDSPFQGNDVNIESREWRWNNGRKKKSGVDPLLGFIKLSFLLLTPNNFLLAVDFFEFFGYDLDFVADVVIFFSFDSCGSDDEIFV